MKRTYTRYFQYQSDNENIALEEIKYCINKEGLFVSSIECEMQEKTEDVPEDWFEDFTFLIKAKIETEESKAKVEEKLHHISEYCDEFTDIESEGQLLDFVQYAYKKDNVEFSSLFLDYDVKMKEQDIFNAYRKMQLRFNGDTIEIPEGDYSKIYEGNMKEFIEKCNDLEGFKRFDDEEELDFCF